MGFLQATFLTALAAIAIPIIVHLIFRWQTRRVELGTVRFLSEILRETARRRRVKRWLLLALRIACVVLLVMLFARPYLLATQRSGAERFMVILIDRSAGMALERDGKRLVDTAVERAQRLLAEADEETDWELAFFDSEVEPLEKGADRADLSQPPQRLSRATNYGTAMAWARDLCVKAPHRRRDVYVFTDLQRSGLDWTATGPFPEDVTVTVDDLGRNDVSNAAVVKAAASQTLVRPGETVLVSATLFNFGPFPLGDVPVSLVLSHQRQSHRLRKTVSLPPQQAVEVEFEVDALTAGLWRGTVELETEDDLAFDNRRYVAVLAAPQQRVLLVDGTPDPDPVLSETYFLEKALRLAPVGETYADSPFAPSVVFSANEGRLGSLGEFDLVVLANVGNMSGADAGRLAEFVRSGGGLLVFTGENVTAASCRSLAEAGLVPGQVGEVARSHDLPFRWRRWDDSHPLLAPFADPQHGDLQRLGFTAYTRLEPAGSARVLARFSTDDPALTEHSIGDGRVLWFLSGCGRAWSDWPRSRLFLPLAHQMLGDLAGLTGGGPIRPVVLDELGRNVGLRREPTTSSPIDGPGIHERDAHWLVVNVSSRESETDRCTLAEFSRRFEIAAMNDLPNNPNPSSGATWAERNAEQLSLRADEIWHLVLWGLLGVVCLEYFVANRTTA